MIKSFAKYDALNHVIYNIQYSKSVEMWKVSCFLFHNLMWVVRSGWVVGSFQCRSVLLLWHMVGQGPAMLAAGAGRVGCFFFFFI